MPSPTVIAKLREVFPDLPDQPDQRTVFLKLRELRNSGFVVGLGRIAQRDVVE